MLLLLLACRAPAPVDTAGPGVVDTGRDTGTDGPGHTADSGGDSAADSGADSAGDSGGDSGADPYWGRPVEPPLDPPAFVVENQRRERRDTEWLRGDPSVLWFFRDTGNT